MAVPNKKSLKNNRVMGVVEESSIQVNTNAVATDESKMHKEPQNKINRNGRQQRKSSIFKYYNLCVCLAIVLYLLLA